MSCNSRGDVSGVPDAPLRGGERRSNKARCDAIFAPKSENRISQAEFATTRSSAPWKRHPLRVPFFMSCNSRVDDIGAPNAPLRGGERRSDGAIQERAHLTALYERNPRRRGHQLHNPLEPRFQGIFAIFLKNLRPRPFFIKNDEGMRSDFMSKKGF